MLEYQEVLDWMFAQLPMYQRIGSDAYKKDLNNTIALMQHLNHPENKFKSIHIAGTNGKGSTSSMIASILQEAGYKVGLYTSPHLKDFRERIKINGKTIEKENVISFINNNKNFLEQHHLSFFEMTVGLAFDYFAKKKVDVAVIEVGLGGRLDSTNVISPLLSVITNIGFDHEGMLGDTLEKIAFEKAGIIKASTPAIIGQDIPETRNVFIEKAKKENAPIYFVSEENIPKKETDLAGIYQKYNSATAQLAIKHLKKHFEISEDNVTNGLKNVIKNTNLLGRWQILNHAPLTVADTGHNKDGLLQTMQQVKQHKYNNLYFVFGIVNDKNLNSIVEYLPKEAYYFFAKPDVPRGLDAKELYEKMTHFGFKGEICHSVNEAFQKAKNKATADDFIYIGGSTFVVAEVI